MGDEATDIAPERVLQLVRQYPHPRERVFAAWTRPEQLVRWWGPKGVHIPQYRLDVRAGGEWETTMRNQDGEEFFVSGNYVEISPPARLVFTWAWRNEGVRGHETTVTVEFNDIGGGTELRLTQAVFESENSRDLHNEGWASSLDCLMEYLQGNRNA